MPELLGDFFPESELPTEASTVVVRQPHDGVSIADLLGSVTLERYEAIAISQALCDKMNQSEDRVRPALITADSVLIAETGDVSVAAATVHSGGATALQQVTDLLRAMMPERGVPTPLRLAVLQSSSAGSLAEWSSTIGYYERPNRKALIQAVYQRAGRAPARPPSFQPACLDGARSGMRHHRRLSLSCFSLNRLSLCRLNLCRLSLSGFSLRRLRLWRSSGTRAIGAFRGPRPSTSLLSPAASCSPRSSEPLLG